MEQSLILKAMQTQLSLTDKDLIDLTAKKLALVIDVSTDAGFKQGKAERAERTKLTTAIDKVAIAGKKDIDEKRKELKNKVEAIYLPLVQVTEIEIKRRADVAAEQAEKEKKRTDAIHASIKQMRGMVVAAKGQSVDDIASFIEGCTEIDCAENFAEFTQEALQTKKEVLAELGLLMNTAISEANIAKARAKLQADQAEQDEKKVQADALQLAQTRLNLLTMIPSTMFGQSSELILRKINAIEKTEINTDEFGELTEQSKAAQQVVLTQLNTMLTNQKMVEDAQAEREKEPAEAQETVLTPNIIDEPVKPELKKYVPELLCSDQQKQQITQYLADVDTELLNIFYYIVFNQDSRMRSEALGHLEKMIRAQKV